MGIAEATGTVTLLITAKPTGRTVSPDETVVEAPSIGACLLELDMVFDFF